MPTSLQPLFETVQPYFTLLFKIVNKSTQQVSKIIIRKYYTTATPFGLVQVQKVRKKWEQPWLFVILDQITNLIEPQISNVPKIMWQLPFSLKEENLQLNLNHTVKDKQTVPVD